MMTIDRAIERPARILARLRGELARHLEEAGRHGSQIFHVRAWPRL